MIPDKQQALELHAKLGSNEKIVSHCEAVAEVAKILSEKVEQRRHVNVVDTKSVYAAALLHDIGRNRTQTVKHGYEGAEIARQNGIDEKIARMIERHVGAGLTKEEAERVGLPNDREYIPQTIEEKIVCFSDKVIGAENQVVPFQDEVQKFKRKGLDFGRLEALKADLEETLGEDPELVIIR